MWPFRKRVEQRALHPFALGLDLVPSNASGVPVTSNTALGLSSVYASVRLLSDVISTLPPDAFIRVGDGREPAPTRPEWLDDPRSGPWYTRADFLSQVMTSLLLNGNAYILTPRIDGQVMNLVVLDPNKVVFDNGVYRVEGEELDFSELLHIRGLMLPGSNLGVSPITAAREAIGLNLAAQKFGAAFFGNGAYPGVIVELPQGVTLSEEGQNALKAAWNEVHRGSSNSHKVAVLTEGAQMKAMTISPEDSQFIETRQFGVSDVARMFGIPPHLIGDASGSTSWGSGLAEQNVAFSQFSLRPWVERIEAALTRLWHSEGADQDMFIKLNMAAVQRGSQKERFENYSVAIDKGFMTVNEVRALEDLPPLPEPVVTGGTTDQPEDTEEVDDGTPDAA